MKEPNWAFNIGTLMMLFGVLNIWGSLSDALWVYAFNHQDQFANALSSFHGAGQGVFTSELLAQTLFSQYETYPDWYVFLNSITPLASLIVSAIYFIAGFYLVVLKPSALLLFYIAIGLSIAFYVFKFCLNVFSGVLGLQLEAPFFVISIVIDCIFLAFVMTKKSDLNPHLQ